ncbi:MAG: NAD-dependent epimerase [Fibrobacterales bacterium]
MKILVTGAAGFIGFHLVEQLLLKGLTVVGIDNINDYYDPNLKFARLNKCGIEKTGAEQFHNQVESTTNTDYSFVRMNLEDKAELEALFAKEQFDYVCNLAAQAGVRYSIENPDAYIQSNVVGFLNILECCRNNSIKHLTYASSSSVYGLNGSLPFKTSDAVNHPVSLYAATKKSNELMAHTYAHLYGIPTTGLRFFTVYGPWGRPDMAPILFASAIFAGKPIKVFNDGHMSRDFTYIDDIVDGIMKVIDKPAEPNKEWDKKAPEANSSTAPYRVYNIGRNAPVNLMDFIKAIETSAGIVAEKNFMPIQPGDVESTHADCTDLMTHYGYEPKITVEDGVQRFIEWYKEYTVTES